MKKFITLLVLVAARPIFFEGEWRMENEGEDSIRIATVRYALLHVHSGENLWPSTFQ